MTIKSIKTGWTGISAAAGNPIEFPTGRAHMWYDASDLETISVSGTAVTQWNDKGSAKVNLTQGTAANRPASGTTTLNGKNVIAYDGGDVLLGTTVGDWKFLHDGTTYVIGIVVKVTTSADPDADIHVFSNIRRAASDVSGRNLQAESRNATVNRLRAYVANGSAVNYTVIQDSADNVWTQNAAVVYTELTDPDNATAADRIKSYFGTGSAIATNTQTNAVSGSNPTYSMAVGATDDLAVNGITGFIAEFVILKDGFATETNRVALRDYLKAKWGL